MATLSCAWSTQSARDARCFNGKNLRTHVVDRAMRLPAPHDGTPTFGPSFSTLSEQGRGAARHLDFGRGRNRSGSSRTCSSCRPEHMSCSHHVQGSARATGAAGNALLRTQQAPWQRRLDVARHRHCTATSKAASKTASKMKTWSASKTFWKQFLTSKTASKPKNSWAGIP